MIITDVDVLLFFFAGPVASGVTTEVVLQDSSEVRKFVPVYCELEEKPLGEQRGLREN